MEAKKRNIKSGAQYDMLFPIAGGNVYTVKKNASLSDTVSFIPKVVQKTVAHTARIAQQLKGDTIYKTCSNIWHFVYGHIQYKKDEKGYEQIRSPSRVWHDRQAGVDCDCYSVFISSILTNLKIPHILRITKYRQDYFQHIYPLVPFSGKYITLDCVTDRFNYEVPYSEKKDYAMDLQYLDGLPSLYQNADDLYLAGAGDGMQELNSLIQRNFANRQPYITDDQSLGLFGSRKKKKAKAAAAAAASAAPTSPDSPAPASPPQPPPKKKKGFLKKLSLRKVLNVVNKVNPATVLLRNGLLAAMKLNISNVAKRLRWAYLSPGQAAAKNIDAAKHQRLVSTKDKMEKIFEGAGGKPSNLRKAILGGKGNKDKAVQGLDGLGMIDLGNLDGMDTYTPLPELLGEIYYSENVEGMNGEDLVEGLGELGEPVSMAAITAAMGAITAIAASLKQIGNIFKGNKGEGSQDFDENVNTAAENNLPVKDTTPVPASATKPVLPAALPTPTPREDYSESSSPVSTPTIQPTFTARTSSASSSEAALPTEVENDYSVPEMPLAPGSATSSPATGSGSNVNPEKKEGFWDKNKKWLKPTLIGVGGVAIIAIGFKMFKSSPQNKSSPQPLSGIGGKKKNHRRKSKHKNKTAVALL
jgi:hypothetical protein